jgi:DNA-directed RNA polymerase subunit omega
LARITVEDCLKRINNRFVLVNVAANRVRQIREGAEYLINSPKNEDIVIALREIAAGKVRLKEGTKEKKTQRIEKQPIENIEETMNDE